MKAGNAAVREKQRQGWIAALFLLVCLAAAAGAAAGQGPRIHAAELKYDFGQVKAGQRAEHLFEIRNSGDDVLVIQKVQSS